MVGHVGGTEDSISKSVVCESATNKQEEIEKVVAYGAWDDSEDRPPERPVFQIEKGI